MKINIIDYAISHSRVFMGILIFIIFSGASTYITMPKESSPDVSIPIGYISLHQNGISAQDSERLLVKPIEDEVKTVEGVKEVRSTAYSGGGNVLLEFDAGFDSDQAMVDIRDKVDRAKGDLPSEADEPTVNEVNISTFPIYVSARGVSSVSEIQISSPRAEIMRYINNYDSCNYLIHFGKFKLVSASLYVSCDAPE